MSMLLDSSFLDVVIVGAGLGGNLNPLSLCGKPDNMIIRSLSRHMCCGKLAETVSTRNVQRVRETSPDRGHLGEEYIPRITVRYSFSGMSVELTG
jgi:hypothetical protein